MLARSLGQLGAAQHASDFLRALVAGYEVDAGPGASADRLLFNQVVMVGEGGDLGQVGDAQDLVRPRQACAISLESWVLALWMVMVFILANLY